MVSEECDTWYSEECGTWYTGMWCMVPEECDT